MKNMIIIAMAFLMAGCGTRRKEVKSLTAGYKFEAALDTTFSFSGFKKEETLSSFNSFLQEQNKIIEYDGQLGDSLCLEEYGSDGNLLNKLVIKGKGKATITNGQKQEQIQASASSSAHEQSEGKASGNYKAKGEAFQEALDKTVTSTPGILAYWWVLLLVLGALWYLNKRYGWLKWLKSHVTAKKTE